MEPACGACRKSKIRCTHRRPVNNPRDASTALPPEAQRPIQPKGRLQTSPDNPGEQTSSASRLRSKKQGQAGVPNEASSQTSQGRPRGRPPKRLASELDVGDDAGTVAEEPELPPKRARCGRRPAQRTGTSAQGKRGPATGPELSDSAKTLAENLTMASIMAMNKCGAEDFQDSVRECEAKWQAVLDALDTAMVAFRGAKQRLDRCFEMWKRGDI
ncbi:hypothetical protein BDV28DRAFT_162341 [Aspergillus coremiiformis]|uniref:Zn(2)-C6 fungal-type domain-containing protein n=1 Tax=Aspergillus coremiiformis TaxID=138285 RepID=A0A5N6Z2B9_9EURO|nr:hypothetical protein BDV28DRAFT_162341 [Aspergillus coremiiformis]